MNKNVVRLLGLSAALLVFPGVASAYCPPTKPPSLQQQCLDREEQDRRREQEIAARERQREQEAARERQREQEARQREQEVARERQREQEVARERQREQEAARVRQREQESAREQGGARERQQRERQQQEAQDRQRKQEQERQRAGSERPGAKPPSLGQGAPLQSPQQQQQQRNVQTSSSPPTLTHTVPIPATPHATSTTTPTVAPPTAQAAPTGPAAPAANTLNAPNPAQRRIVQGPAGSMSQADLLQQQRSGQAQIAPVAPNPSTAQGRPPAPVVLPTVNTPQPQRRTAQGAAAPLSQSELLQQQRGAQTTLASTSTSPTATTITGRADTSGAGQSAQADASGSAGGGKKAPKKVTWGPIQQEAVAICRQQKSKTWQCFGPLDNDVLGGDTLERGLARQRCAGGTWAAGGPVLHEQQWEAYRCGHALGAGDYDLVKRYGMITAQRSYMCPQYQAGDGRCVIPYDGQDKR